MILLSFVASAWRRNDVDLDTDWPRALSLINGLPNLRD